MSNRDGAIIPDISIARVEYQDISEHLTTLSHASSTRIVSQHDLKITNLNDVESKNVSNNDTLYFRSITGASIGKCNIVSQIKVIEPNPPTSTHLVDAFNNGFGTTRFQVNDVVYTAVARINYTLITSEIPTQTVTNIDVLPVTSENYHTGFPTKLNVAEYGYTLSLPSTLGTNTTYLEHQGDGVLAWKVPNNAPISIESTTSDIIVVNPTFTVNQDTAHSTTLTLSDSGVASAWGESLSNKAYGSTTKYAIFTVDRKGRIIAADELDHPSQYNNQVNVYGKESPNGTLTLEISNGTFSLNQSSSHNMYIGMRTLTPAPTSAPTGTLGGVNGKLLTMSVDEFGRVTAIEEAAFANPSDASVTISAGVGLVSSNNNESFMLNDENDYTNTLSLATVTNLLENSSTLAGTYGDESKQLVPRIQLDNYGRVVGISTFDISAAAAANNSLVTLKSTSDLTINAASSSNFTLNAPTSSEFDFQLKPLVPSPSGTYNAVDGSNFKIPNITINSKGLVTAVTQSQISFPTISDAQVEVKGVANQIVVSTGAFQLNQSAPNDPEIGLAEIDPFVGVDATKEFGSASKTPVVTIDKFGRVTAVSEVDTSGGSGGGSSNLVTFIGDVTASVTNGSSASSFALNSNSDVVVSLDIGTGVVTEAMLGSLAVTETKIGALAVTTGKIAAGAIDSTKLGSGVVQSTHLESRTLVGQTVTKFGAVATINIQNDAVTTEKIVDGAITEAKLGSASVTSTKLGLLSVNTGHIADGAVSASKASNEFVLTSTDQSISGIKSFVSTTVISNAPSGADTSSLSVTRTNAGKTLKLHNSDDNVDVIMKCKDNTKQARIQFDDGETDALTKNMLKYDHASNAFSIMVDSATPLSMTSSTVTASTLNASTLTTSSITMSGSSIVGVVTDVAGLSSQAASKAYVDGLTSGHRYISPVDFVALQSVVKDQDAPVVDGVTLGSGDDGKRLLLTKQGGSSVDIDNGVWVYVHGGTWTRASDMAAASDARNIALFVTSGNSRASSGFVQTQDPAIVGTNGLGFVLFQQVDISTGLGIEKVATTLSMTTPNLYSEGTCSIGGSGHNFIDTSGLGNHLISGDTSTTLTVAQLTGAMTNGISEQEGRAACFRLFQNCHVVKQNSVGTANHYWRFSVRFNNFSPGTVTKSLLPESETQGLLLLEKHGNASHANFVVHFTSSSRVYQGVFAYDKFMGWKSQGLFSKVIDLSENTLTTGNYYPIVFKVNGNLNKFPDGEMRIRIESLGSVGAKKNTNILELVCKTRVGGDLDLGGTMWTLDVMRNDDALKNFGPILRGTGQFHGVVVYVRAASTPSDTVNESYRVSTNFPPTERYTHSNTGKTEFYPIMVDGTVDHGSGTAGQNTVAPPLTVTQAQDNSQITTLVTNSEKMFNAYELPQGHYQFTSTTLLVDRCLVGEGYDHDGLVGLFRSNGKLVIAASSIELGDARHMQSSSTSGSDTVVSIKGSVTTESTQDLTLANTDTIPASSGGSLVCSGGLSVAKTLMCGDAYSNSMKIVCTSDKTTTALSVVAMGSEEERDGTESLLDFASWPFCLASFVGRNYDHGGQPGVLKSSNDLSIGTAYIIQTLGSTAWDEVGASQNATVGEIFTATQTADNANDDTGEAYPYNQQNQHVTESNMWGQSHLKLGCTQLESGSPDAHPSFAYVGAGPDMFSSNGSVYNPWYSYNVVEGHQTSCFSVWTCQGLVPATVNSTDENLANRKMGLFLDHRQRLGIGGMRSLDGSLDVRQSRLPHDRTDATQAITPYNPVVASFRNPDMVKFFSIRHGSTGSSDPTAWSAEDAAVHDTELRAEQGMMLKVGGSTTNALSIASDGAITTSGDLGVGGALTAGSLTVDTLEAGNFSNPLSTFFMTIGDSTTTFGTAEFTVEYYDEVAAAYADLTMSVLDAAAGSTTPVEQSSIAGMLSKIRIRRGVGASATYLSNFKLTLASTFSGGRTGFKGFIPTERVDGNYGSLIIERDSNTGHPTAMMKFVSAVAKTWTCGFWNDSVGQGSFSGWGLNGEYYKYIESSEGKYGEYYPLVFNVHANRRNFVSIKIYNESNEAKWANMDLNFTAGNGWDGGSNSMEVSTQFYSRDGHDAFGPVVLSNGNFNGFAVYIKRGTNNISLDVYQSWPITRLNEAEEFFDTREYPVLDIAPLCPLNHGTVYPVQNANGDRSEVKIQLVSGEVKITRSVGSEDFTSTLVTTSHIAQFLRGSTLVTNGINSNGSTGNGTQVFHIKEIVSATEMIAFETSCVDEDSVQYGTHDKAGTTSPASGSASRFPMMTRNDVFGSSNILFSNYNGHSATGRPDNFVRCSLAYQPSKMYTGRTYNPGFGTRNVSNSVIGAQSAHGGKLEPTMNIFFSPFNSEDPGGPTVGGTTTFSSSKTSFRHPLKTHPFEIDTSQMSVVPPTQAGATLTSLRFEGSPAILSAGDKVYLGSPDSGEIFPVVSATSNSAGTAHEIIVLGPSQSDPTKDMRDAFLLMAGTAKFITDADAGVGSNPASAKTVIGVGTQFMKHLHPGDTILTSGDNMYVIDNILSQTELSLTTSPTVNESGGSGVSFHALKMVMYKLEKNQSHAQIFVEGQLGIGEDGMVASDAVPAGYALGIKFGDLHTSGALALRATEPVLSTALDIMRAGDGTQFASISYEENAIPVQSMVHGTSYTILDVGSGTTNWSNIGASTFMIGDTFVADTTTAATGDGVVYRAAGEDRISFKLNSHNRCHLNATGRIINGTTSFTRNSTYIFSLTPATISTIAGVAINQTIARYSAAISTSDSSFKIVANDGTENVYRVLGETANLEIRDNELITRRPIRSEGITVPLILGGHDGDSTVPEKAGIHIFSAGTNIGYNEHRGLTNLYQDMQMHWNSATESSPIKLLKWGKIGSDGIIGNTDMEASVGITTNENFSITCNNGDISISPKRDLDDSDKDLIDPLNHGKVIISNTSSLTFESAAGSQSDIRIGNATIPSSEGVATAQKGENIQIGYDSASRLAHSVVIGNQNQSAGCTSYQSFGRGNVMAHKGICVGYKNYMPKKESSQAYTENDSQRWAEKSVCIGAENIVQSTEAVCIGNLCYNGTSRTITIGAEVEHNRGSAFDDRGGITNYSGIGIGHDVKMRYSRTIGIGSNIEFTASAHDTNSLSDMSLLGGIVIGDMIKTNTDKTLVVGSGYTTNSKDCVALVLGDDTNTPGIVSYNSTLIQQKCPHTITIGQDFYMGPTTPDSAFLASAATLKSSVMIGKKCDAYSPFGSILIGRSCYSYMDVNAFVDYNLVPVTELVAGKTYQIQSSGNTDWTATGWNNNANNVFVATSSGTGTGVAYEHPKRGIWSNPITHRNAVGVIIGEENEMGQLTKNSVCIGIKNWIEAGGVPYGAGGAYPLQFANIVGAENQIRVQGEGCSIVGHNNVIGISDDGTSYSSYYKHNVCILGNLNELKPRWWTPHGSIGTSVLGSDNVVFQNDDCIVSGNQNKIGLLSHVSVLRTKVLGSLNQITTHDTIVLGDENFMARNTSVDTGSYSSILGHLNEVGLWNTSNPPDQHTPFGITCIGYMNKVYSIDGTNAQPKGRGVNNTIVIGQNNTKRDGDKSVVIGHNNDIGMNSYGGAGSSFLETEDNISAVNDSVVIGVDTIVRGTRAIVLGKSAQATRGNCISIGHQAKCNGNGGGGYSTISIGDNASNEHRFGIAIGLSATSGGTFDLGSSWVGDAAISIGTQSKGKASHSIAMGYYAQAYGRLAVSIGHTAIAGSSTNAAHDFGDTGGQVAVGYYANAVPFESTAVGPNATVQAAGSVALGANILNTYANTTGLPVASASALTASQFDDLNDVYVHLIAPGGTGNPSNTHQISSLFYTGFASDYRLKNDVVEMRGCLERVKACRVVSFSFKDGYDQPKGDQEGFIAHELQEAGQMFGVTKTKDAVDEKGNPKYQSVRKKNLIPTLWGAVRELAETQGNVKEGPGASARTKRFPVVYRENTKELEYDTGVCDDSEIESASVISGCLGHVQMVKAKQFRRKSTDEIDYGFVASEAKSRLAHLMSTGSDGKKRLDKSPLIFHLWNAVGELHAQLNKERVRNDKLEKRLALLEAKMA